MATVQELVESYLESQTDYMSYSEDKLEMKPDADALRGLLAKSGFSPAEIAAEYPDLEQVLLDHRNSVVEAEVQQKISDDPYGD